MHPQTSMTAAQRLTAVDLFEEGLGHKLVSARLGVSVHAVRGLERRFVIWGRAALTDKTSKHVFSFEFKLAVVRQFIDGEGSLMDLAQMHQLSSPVLLRRWVKNYRDLGEEGLRPKPKGRRPRAAVGQPPPETSEVEKLRGEIHRLQAENAYLKKVRALRNQAQR
jgi:transposase